MCVGERVRACPSWATGCVTCCASIALPQERDGEEADDEGEGEDVPEHEARRRRGLTASARRVQKLRALEKANPYGVLRVVYLTDLYNSKRFEHVDAGLRYAIIVHVLHHHQRHVLQGEDDAVLGPAPYLRRRRGRSHGSGYARSGYGMTVPVVWWRSDDVCGMTASMGDGLVLCGGLSVCADGVGSIAVCVTLATWWC